MRTFALLATLLAALAATPAPVGAQATAPALRDGASHAVPLYGTLAREWNAPEDDPFAAGHRGVDVAADPGTPVRASADGTVTFAGSVAGNRTVTVDHGDGVWTTYSFLGTISVPDGAAVRRGDTVGTVGTGHPTAGLPPHVHIAARRSGVYFDPIVLYVGSSSADLLALTA